MVACLSCAREIPAKKQKTLINELNYILCKILLFWSQL